MKTMEEPDNEFAKKQGLWFCSEVRLNYCPACMLWHHSPSLDSS